MRFVPFLRGKTKKYYNLSVLYNVVMGEVVNNAGMSCSVRNGDYVDSDADLDAVIQETSAMPTKLSPKTTDYHQFGKTFSYNFAPMSYTIMRVKVTK